MAYTRTKPEDRENFERVVFAKLIDYRRDVKRGKISEAERSRMDAKISSYTNLINHQKES